MLYVDEDTSLLEPPAVIHCRLANTSSETLPSGVQKDDDGTSGNANSWQKSKCLLAHAASVGLLLLACINLQKPLLRPSSASAKPTSIDR